MNEESTAFLGFVKCASITIIVLMVVVIVSLMVTSRGKGEDITGIVAPALLITLVAGVIAIITTVLQRRL